MCAINTYCSNWRATLTHESSPGGRGVSPKLKRECTEYSCSQYYSNIKPGEYHPDQGFQCQDLQKLTFTDNYFDLFVTQDVMEHVFDPDAVFREIARVLKPGGLHIFTVPIVNKFLPTSLRAELSAGGEIDYIQEAQFHGNPVDSKGSLVTIDWGYDIVKRIVSSANTPTTLLMMDDISQGIRAELLDVLVSRKL